MVGYTYERYELNRIAKEVLPPGELVDIGGRNIHLHIQGEGNPTVIFESGVAGSSPDWALVAPEVAKFTRVVSYDRAGLCWSDTTDAPPTARSAVEDLHKALDAKGVEGPFILVGHSLGGMLVRMFYYLHPEDVAGLVLVDPGHEDEDERFPQEYHDLIEYAEMGFSMARTMSIFGMTRVLMRDGGGFFPERKLLPEAAQSALRDLGPRYSQINAAIQEIDAWEVQCSQIREAAIPIGDLLLTVLIAEKPPYGMGQPYVDASMEVKSELAGLSSSGRRRVVKDSAHFIHVERPDVVIEEILRMVDSLRDSVFTRSIVDHQRHCVRFVA